MRVYLDKNLKESLISTRLLLQSLGTIIAWPNPSAKARQNMNTVVLNIIMMILAMEKAHSGDASNQAHANAKRQKTAFYHKNGNFLKSDWLIQHSIFS